jgi:hypothetical protein
MRTLVANHILAQQQDSRTPYIYMIFKDKTEVTTYDFSTDSTAYGNRILLIDHTEEPYNDFAYIMLQNTDRLVPDLKGYHTNIGYGDTYSGTNYYSSSPKLWVKEQRTVSAGGKLYTLLVLEGIWGLFREQLLIGDMNTALLKRYYDPDNFIDEYPTDLQTATVFYLLYYIEEYIDAACGTAITITMDSTQDDGIINSYVPGKELNAIPYESCADLFQQLLGFTKCFVRIEETDNLEVRYPQTTESVDHTYYSYQQHYFLEYTNNDILLIPNHIVVLAGQYLEDSGDHLAGDWPPYDQIIKAEAQDTTEIAAYMKVTNLHYAGFIQQQADAQDRADAIMYKVEYQLLHGKLVIPHDASVELYDLVEIVDTRGN